MWYVCKRCLESFETISVIKDHQTRQTPCQLKHHSESAELPHEVINDLRLKKGAKDCGSMVSYFDHVLLRMDETEIKNVLSACSLVDLYKIIELVNKLENVHRIKCLSQFANFCDANDSSPEKISVIRNFILEQTTL